MNFRAHASAGGRGDSPGGGAPTINRRKETMSIVDPSVLELLNHADSRYALVVEASKRAREIVGGATPAINAEGMKPLKIAVEEINRGLLTYESPAEEE